MQMSLRAFGKQSFPEEIAHRLWMVVRNDILKMGREGVEPSWCLHRRILSPLRLPIPPSPRHRPASAAASADRTEQQPALYRKVKPMTADQQTQAQKTIREFSLESLANG